MRYRFAIIICKLVMWIRINQEPLVCFMNLHMIALGPQYNKVLLREQKAKNASDETLATVAIFKNSLRGLAPTKAT